MSIIDVSEIGVIPVELNGYPLRRQAYDNAVHLAVVNFVVARLKLPRLGFHAVRHLNETILNCVDQRENIVFDLRGRIIPSTHAN